MQTKKNYLFLVFLSLFSLFTSAHSSISRYFPRQHLPLGIAIERGSMLKADYFLTTASSAYGNDRETIGIGELTAPYDLKMLSHSVSTYLNATTGTSPDFMALIPENLAYRDLMYKAESKIKTAGCTLGYVQDIFKSILYGGVSIPLVHVNTVQRLVFKQPSIPLTVSDQESVERVRRMLHSYLYLKGNVWDKTSCGDLSFFLRAQHTEPYIWLFKQLSPRVECGIQCPTAPQKNSNYPSSIPLGNDGHWAFYQSLALECMLKTGITIQTSVHFKEYLSKTHDRRIAIYAEPDIYSPVTTRLKEDKGIDFRSQSYVRLDNILPGLFFQAGYTYTRHFEDTLTPLLCNNMGSDSFQGYSYTSEGNPTNSLTKIKKRKTLWFTHYLSFRLCYNMADKETPKKWYPYVYLTYDMPFGGRNATKTHEVTLSISVPLP